MSDNRSARESRQPPVDDVIELEPTLAGYAETSLDRAPVGDAARWFAASPGLASELAPLLRSRLQAAAGFLGLAYVVFLLFSLVSPDSFFRLAAPSLGLRMLIAVAVFGVLASRVSLTCRQLRCIEYGFFGIEMLLILQAQYSISLQLLERGDFISLVAYEKNGVLRTFMLMMIYGVFIPNHPRITSSVVLSMAVGPIVVLALVVHHELEVTAMDLQMAGYQYVVSNALFLLLGGTLSIFSAHVLNGMRREVSEARRLGQYRLLEKLGEGGMGEVYLAEHQLLKRPCALKLINPDLEDKSIALARFEREVQSAAQLSHPNTIEIYDYGRADDGTFYYVMEYLPGLSVADLIRRGGPLPASRAVYIARQVCGALAEAHRRGMIHRDLKPANILVAVLGGECDVAKVLDFGLVKLTDPAAAAGPQLTAEYSVSGTPAFMSPEQAFAQGDIDGRADLYALGAILYFMVTGKPPFERETAMALMMAQAKEPVRPPSQLCPGLPADLEAVILRCLAKEPGERYPDARAVSAALADCACAAEWSQTEAERWWLEQANAPSVG
jgi:eukaryotic-like serine/threonine-protein kinase